MFPKFEYAYTPYKQDNVEAKKRFVPPNELRNEEILNRNQIFSNEVYREYLIDNGKKIIKKNNENYKNA